MKKAKFFWFAVLGGILEMVLSAVLFAFFLDEKGLIIPSPLPALIWTIAAAAVIGGICASGRNVDIFPACSHRAAAVGSFLLAVGLILSGLFAPQKGINFLRLLLLPLSVAAGLAMAYSGLCRLRGKGISLWCYAPTAIYLIVFMVHRYRVWSARPQLMAHVFDVLACASLILAVYWHCAESCGIGSSKKMGLYTFTALFFCLAALGHGEAPWLYLTAAIWLITNTCVKKETL